MAKLKSFEQFVAEMDRTEEIEKDNMELAEPQEKDVEEVEAEAEEVQEEEDEDTEEVEVVETPAEESDIEDSDEDEDDSDEDEDDSDEDEDEDESDDDDSEEDDEDDEDESDDDDAEEAIEESEEVEEDRAEEIEKDNMDKAEPKALADMLTELYEGSCKNEAKAWEEDAHDEHTIESYMKENAALVAGLAAKALKEMKDEFAVEAYEAACNEMVDAYTKKMNEMKEMDSAADAGDTAE